MINNQKKIGIILTYLSQGIQIITALVYTPIMLRLLGKNEYGLYQLVFSVVSYLSLLSFGFASSYMRYYSRIKIKKNNDQDLDLSKLNGMYMIMFLIIAGICIICGVVMIKNIEFIFGSSLSTEEYNTARILMGFMVFNIAITFPNSLFDSITSAHEKFFFQKLLIVLNSFLNPFLTLPLLLVGYGSIGMVIITTALTVVKFIVNAYYCINKLNTNFIFNDFNFKLLKDIWKFTFFIFINIIVDQVNWNVDKYLLGRIVGTAAVAVYGVGAQLNALYLHISVSISNVFIPEVNRIVVESNDNIKLTELFTKIGRLQLIIIFPVLVGFLFFGKRFITLWAGEGYIDSYYVGLLLMLPVTIPLIQNIGIEIQRAKNKHQARSIAYLLIAIVNVVLSIPLINKWGVIGSAVGTAITMFLGTGLFMNIYYHRSIRLDMVYFWKEIGRLIPAFILPVVVGAIVFSIDSILTLPLYLFCGVLFVVTYICSVWFWGLRKNEKEKILSRF